MHSTCIFHICSSTPQNPNRYFSGWTQAGCVKCGSCSLRLQTTLFWKSSIIFIELSLDHWLHKSRNVETSVWALGKLIRSVDNENHCRWLPAASWGQVLLAQSRGRLHRIPLLNPPVCASFFNITQIMCITCALCWRYLNLCFLFLSEPPNPFCNYLVGCCGLKKILMCGRARRHPQGGCRLQPLFSTHT